VTAELTTVQARLAEALENAGRVLVRLPDVQELFTSVRPRTSEHTDRRRELHSDLQVLADAGRVRLPRQERSWDHTAAPPLPKFVTVSPTAIPKPTATRVRGAAVGWRPEMHWAARERDWSPRRAADLIAINRFLSGAAERPVVPLRERSVQLFGDEKRLGALLADSRVFGPDRLTLDMLRTHRTSPPFISRSRTADRDDALIVENWDTFVTLAEHGPPVGTVLYGAGAHVTAALPSLGAKPPAALWYFGDLDTAGLAMAARANSTACDLDLPPVRPAKRLYRLLLEHGVPQPTGTRHRSTEAFDAGARWLDDEELEAGARTLLEGDHRLAQEQVGVELLASLCPREP